MKQMLSAFFSLVFLVSCSREAEVKVSVPIAQEPSVRTFLGDSKQSYEVLGSESLLLAIQNQEMKLASQRKIRKDSLSVAFPKTLLRENFVFGGVVTKVSDLKNESLGNLKLSDLPPIFVKPELSVQENNFQMDLKGCLEKCTETSPEETIISVPVIALDKANDRVVLDLAAIGEKLNLIKMMDPKGEYTQLKTIRSQVSSVDFSLSTLVFDVEVTMVPLEVKAGQSVSETKFTVRWYLRLGSVFNPSFVSRDKTEGVGFFMTERSLFPKIIRHSLSGSSQGPVKYFLKNIPNEHKDSFRKAFEAWNEKFIGFSGKPLLRIEFVDAEDPRAQRLVAGDIRYNILEWDLENQASYGGLGPSIANQVTGEILSSNVLVQGPRIVQIYKNWFKVAEKSAALRDQGKTKEAEILLKEFALSQEKSHRQSTQTKVELSLGVRNGFRIHSQLPPTQDPLFQKEDFDLTPENITYEEYMDGYFMDLVAHEVGHNLGLRHNFFGNLGATEGAPTLGKVSSSIMEYLGRSFRYLDQIGPYDVMALKYGYLGSVPEIKNGFCTDEQVPDTDSVTLSAECSRDDATTDPFGFLATRLKRSVDLILARGTVEAPAWKADEMIKTAGAAVKGLAFYASSASSTGGSWAQFFNKPGRPQKLEEVPDFVLGVMEQTLCPQDLEQTLAQKSAEAQLETKLNLLGFIKQVNETLKPFKFEKSLGSGCLGR